MAAANYSADCALPPGWRHCLLASRAARRKKEEVSDVGCMVNFPEVR